MALREGPLRMQLHTWPPIARRMATPHHLAMRLRLRLCKHMRLCMRLRLHTATCLIHLNHSQAPSSQHMHRILSRCSRLRNHIQPIRSQCSRLPHQVITCPHPTQRHVL